MKIESAQVDGVIGLFFVLFLGLFLSCQLQLMQYRASSLYMEDALAASNLASAIIDLQEYGITNKVLIKDPEMAYESYRKALQKNLELDEEMVSAKDGLIDGKVIVEDYIVYNVEEQQVFSFRVIDEGVIVQRGLLGEVKAPNGVMVENTGVYSEISYPVNQFLGKIIWARKGKLVDVTTS
ncbi:MAG: hypothetical protein II994_00765 [Lachnospiraceae bacterium]|nr:hypothetical protein [Lachnospiraceae bacterium]